MILQKSSKIVYENQWMKVREDEVEFANGKSGVYGVVEKPDFVLIIPFDGSHFYLVQQYRYPIQKESWEFPSGMDEKNSNKSNLELAKMELKQETGIVAQQIQKIGYLYEANGYATQAFGIFLATDLIHDRQELEDSEQVMKAEKFTVNQIEKMIEGGEITDAPTVSAYGLLKIKKII